MPFASPPGWRGPPLPRASSPRGGGTRTFTSARPVTVLCQGMADSAWSQMSMRMCQGSSQRYQANRARMPAATRLCSPTSVPEVFPSPFKLLGSPFGIRKRGCIPLSPSACPSTGRASLHHQGCPHPVQSPPASDSLIWLRNHLLLFVASSFLQSEADPYPRLSTSHLVANFPQKEGAGSPLGPTAGTRHLLDPGKWWPGPISSGTAQLCCSSPRPSRFLSQPRLPPLQPASPPQAVVWPHLQPPKFCHIPRQGSLSLQMPESMSKRLVSGPKRAGSSPG